ncbi:hypothetical protein GCM10011348_12340 [Marinobacterium nitratireducens]|uniref:Uncharacterized protein n=1 Tax=Marinobacterium nitratireducens TaxID=518897 RepID=A0A918DR87_9GAMM|nr:hypothetical protein [Marinobacterium nitratireducens]GGO79037.1 hypothetical protein GCM10011348_12340 [Marinobacterium nitratireducens]
MIHHYSIAVADTVLVSEVLARLVDGTVTRFGPYPNSRILWFGDEPGTAIELYPAGTEMVPGDGDAQAGFVHNPAHSGYTATHAAISVPRSREEIFALAREQGWRAVELPRGGFDVIEFWIENRVMIELLTPEMAADYLSVTRKYRKQPEADASEC